MEEQKKACKKPLIFIFSLNPQGAPWGMKDKTDPGVRLAAKRKLPEGQAHLHAEGLSDHRIPGAPTMQLPTSLKESYTEEDGQKQED